MRGVPKKPKSAELVPGFPGFFFDGACGGVFGFRGMRYLFVGGRFSRRPLLLAIMKGLGLASSRFAAETFGFILYLIKSLAFV